MTTSHRFSTLDGMRGIASIAIMLHHFTQHTLAAYFPTLVWLLICSSGLGGFVVAYSYLDRLQKSMSAKEFLIKRLIRLYPMFLIGMSLGAIAILWKYSNGQTNFEHQSNHCGNFTKFTIFAVHFRFLCPGW